jgi:hypothetical protein
MRASKEATVLYSEVAFRHCHGETTVNYETNQSRDVTQAKSGTKYVSNKGMPLR